MKSAMMIGYLIGATTPLHTQYWPRNTYVSFAHVAMPMRLSADTFDEAISGTDFVKHAYTGIPYGTMQSQMPSVATMCTSGRRIDGQLDESEYIGNLFMTEKTLLSNEFLTVRQLSDLMETDTSWPTFWVPDSAIFMFRMRGFEDFLRSRSMSVTTLSIANLPQGLRRSRA